VHGGTKRKAELPPRPGKGKDMKKMRVALLGSGPVSGAGSASGVKGPESDLIELRSTSQIPSSTPLTVWRRIIL